MENSIEFFLNTHLEWSLSHQGFVITTMHWIIEMWYYGLKENDLNELAKTVLHILLCIMFCCFQRERMDGIQEFQSVVLNLENEGRMQGKEMKRNVLAHRWCLIHATMSIVFMSEMVLSHLFSMVESCFSSLWLMYRQIVSRGNSTELGHINILLDLSSTRDFRMCKSTLREAPVLLQCSRARVLS